MKHVKAQPTKQQPVVRRITSMRRERTPRKKVGATILCAVTEEIKAGKRMRENALDQPTTCFNIIRVCTVLKNLSHHTGMVHQSSVFVILHTYKKQIETITRNSSARIKFWSLPLAITGYLALLPEIIPAKKKKKKRSGL